MAQKKFLNRDNKKNQVSADDEWAHLVGVEEGPKLEISDVLDVEDRNIFIRSKKPKKYSTTDVIQEGITETGFKTRTTDQYVRLVNAIFDARLAEIERIKKRKEIFDGDLELLNTKESEDYDKFKEIPVKELESKDVAKLIKAISNEKGNTKTRLEHHKIKATSLEKKLEEQDKKIKELDEKLKEKISHEKVIKEKKSEEDIQDELKILGKLYGMDKLSKALKMINSTEGDE